MAISATLHCLLGCAIGEIAGLVIGTALGWSNLTTLAISIGLAFVVGYCLSIRPLLRAGLILAAALPIILAADTLSIAAMEVTDTIVEASIPGALNAGLNNSLFWITMPISLAAAFCVAVPVNYYLLRRGRGHALTHQYHHSDAHEHHETEHHD
jgi:putative flippase GtrA